MFYYILNNLAIYTLKRRSVTFATRALHGTTSKVEVISGEWTWIVNWIEENTLQGLELKTKRALKTNKIIQIKLREATILHLRNCIEQTADQNWPMDVSYTVQQHLEDSKNLTAYTGKV